MEKLSPANQALIERMQNNNQVQQTVQQVKTPDIPNDSVELSTKVKKPKNKVAMVIGGIAAGVAVAAGLVVAYKKGLFFKLEGAALKKEADRAYQKAQVAVDEVTELINKGLKENLEEFTDEKTGRTIKLFDGLIEEYDGGSLARNTEFSTDNGKIDIATIKLFKKGEQDSFIGLSDNKITVIGKGITLNKEGESIKFSRGFDYEKSMFVKNMNAGINDDDFQGKFFGYDDNGKLSEYCKRTKTQEKGWSPEEGFKRAKITDTQVEVGEPEVIIVEEAPIDLDDIPAEEKPIDFSDIVEGEAEPEEHASLWDKIKPGWMDIEESDFAE